MLNNYYFCELYIRDFGPPKMDEPIYRIIIIKIDIKLFFESFFSFIKIYEQG